MSKDSIEIPIADLEPTGTPGVHRVKPSPAFLAWVASQGLILIVPPTQEKYEQWKVIATEKPESWEAKVLHHPDNQDLFKELKV